MQNQNVAGILASHEEKCGVCFMLATAMIPSVLCPVRFFATGRVS